MSQAPFVSITRRLRGTLHSVAIALLAALALLAAPAPASADVVGDPGWTEPTSFSASTGETAFTRQWRCAGASCSYTGSQTRFKAVAVNGATFSPASTQNFFHLFSTVGTCQITAAAIECQLTKDFTQTTQGLRPGGSIKLNVPPGTPNGTTLVEFSWSDPGTVTGNDPANDTGQHIYSTSAYGDWGHERADLFRSAGTRGGGIEWTCISPVCAYATGTTFEAAAVNGAAFTAPIGTTLELRRVPTNPVQPIAKVGTCTVVTPTSLLCAPTSLTSVVNGTVLTVAAEYEVPAGLDVGTPVLEVSWHDPDALENDPANDVRTIRAALSNLVLADPVQVFSEGFEHQSHPAPIMITDYIGAPPLEQTYWADQPWLEGCNGIIASEANPDKTLPAASFPSCGQTAGDPDGFLQELKAIAWGAGAVDEPVTGIDPNLNHAVGAYTSGNPGAGLVELGTVKPIPVVPGRFYRPGITAVGLNCHAGHPLLALDLSDGSTVTSTTPRPVNPCTEAQATLFSPKHKRDVTVARLDAKRPVIFSGSELSMRVVNHQGSGSGNDGGFDELRLVEVTPRLEKAFSPTGIREGEASTLTFTIVNSSELAAKDGWEFTDALPEGLSVAAGEPVVSGCGEAAVTAPVGSETITVDDGMLEEGQEGCTVSLPILATRPGDFENCAANVHTSGLLPPGCAYLSVEAAPPAPPAPPVTTPPVVSEPPRPEAKKARRKPALVVEKVANTNRARPGSVLSYRITVANKGRGVARDVTICDNPPAQQRTLRTTPRTWSQKGTCWRLEKLAPGDERTFTLTAMVEPDSGGGVQRNQVEVRGGNVKGVRDDTATVRVRPLSESGCFAGLLGWAVPYRC